MPIEFIDRVPSKLGRVKITPESGGSAYYAVIERADEPLVVGTPLSAVNLNEAQETMIYDDLISTSTYRRVYLSPEGSDYNSGNSASEPMKSLRVAVQRYAKWHKSLDFYLLDGTYEEDIGSISTDSCSIAIRSSNGDMDAVTIQTSTMIESHINQLRLYNITINTIASEVRALSVNAGTLYANNVRFIMPAASTSACINVYNGASAFMTDCIINAGTNAAGIYGNQALLIRAWNCTSERTIATGFYANNGSVIEYEPTMTATRMTLEANDGKCIPLAARAGSVDGAFGDLAGQYMTFDGLLIQWGTVSITPSAANVATGAAVTFPIAYESVPTVFLAPISSAPNTISVGVVRSGDLVTDATKQVGVMLVRSSVTATSINWLAIGKGSV